MRRRTYRVGIGVSVIFLTAAFAFVVWAVAPLRQAVPVLPTTKILDRNRGLLYDVARPSEGIRTSITFSRIPMTLRQSIVAAEDARFFQHRGVDARAILRVVWDLLWKGRLISGASTIEQQLVKNVYFPRAPRTVLQKAREWLCAGYWAMSHSKEQTLELYANTVYLGNQANGVASAAQTYFHKSIQDLTLAESALLAGMIAAPSRTDPYRDFARAKQRQTHVLERLVKTGQIAEAMQAEAATTDITIFPPRHPLSAPHFAFRVLDELERTIPDIRTAGYTVRTTLDPMLQTSAEEIIRRRLFPLKKQHVSNAALMAIDPRSGEVLAYVGSRDYFDNTISGQVDMVRVARQPGSALKPFLYFQAFLQGMTPATIVPDLPVRFETSEGKPYYPRNYGYRYFGPVSLRDALGSSLNIPAVRVLHDLGLASFFDTLHRFGMDFPQSPDFYGLGMVLGGGEVTLERASMAYAQLARSAQSVEQTMVLEVRDAGQNVVWQPSATKSRPLYADHTRAAQAAYLVTHVLSDPGARAKSFGEANLLDVDGKGFAVKTGTTKDFRDNWAFGYAPNLVVGVWVGNADQTPMEGVSGIAGAVPIWHDVMQKRFAHAESVIWQEPEGVIVRDTCAVSGLLTNNICPKTRRERFIAGTEPTQPDTWYVQAYVDAKTGLLASEACQIGTVVKTFLQPPPEYAAWFAATKYEQMPVQDCTGKLIASEQPPVILAPLDGDVIERDPAIDEAHRLIPFYAGGTRILYRWKLNGQMLSSSDAIQLWDPKPGEYTLELEGAKRAIRFSVR